MKLLLIALIIWCAATLQAQQKCGELFAKNLKIGNKQNIETKPYLIHSTASFEYEIVFQITDEGIFMKMTSTDIHSLEKDDTRIMFVAEDDEKKLLNFISF